VPGGQGGASRDLTCQGLLRGSVFPGCALMLLTSTATRWPRDGLEDRSWDMSFVGSWATDRPS
jgi:hypothetical protein